MTCATSHLTVNITLMRSLKKLTYIGLALITVILCQCAKLQPSTYKELGKSAPSVQSTHFKHELAKVAKASWYDKSHVTPLPNGDSFFPEMRKAVQSAKHTITFESFAVVSGTETYYLCLELAKKAQQGVKVHVILDGIGSRKLGKVCTDILEKSGCELKWYHKLNLLKPHYSNNRDHRKLLIVDGKVGFIGGAGYANSWMGNASNITEWRDTMYKVTGKAVADMQTIFSNNWKELTNSTLSGYKYFPQLSNTGSMSVQHTMGAPRERDDTIGASYLLAIDAAKKTLLIEHAYFAPNKELRDSIKRALSRGVKVKIILPGDPIDSKILREASKIYWPELITAGAEIYEYQTSLMHAKLMIIDDYLTIAGSANFDDRSFFINDEANIHILSSQLAKQATSMFNYDLKHCKRMTIKDSKLKFRAIDIFNRAGAYLLTPQL